MSILEAQTCPSRMREFGPWERKEGLDRWTPHRWTTSEEEDQKEADEFQAKYPGSTRGSRLWKWSWGPARTCTFCGGIHPEDAIRLVSEGWEIDNTGKSYKRYLNPPGSTQSTDALINAMRREQLGEGRSAVPSVWSPTPPVKVYVAHFDEDQCRRFNEAAGYRTET